MTDKYKIQDILEAVDTIINNNSDKEKPLKLENEEEKPLKLTDEVNNLKTELRSVPKETEKIILQAEKYLKK
tara:strand:- start:45 stop:260 length:216 start_codon:yes stop_codon:yes gene_type:complete